MTLSDVVLPVDIAWARGHALVFSQAMSERLQAVQADVGDQRYRLEPAMLADGRFMVGGDILTECVAGGFLQPAFDMLDRSRFALIEVVPIAEALALLPPADNA